MTAQLLAFAAAAVGVAAAWEAAAVAGALTDRVAAVVAPLRVGREPDDAERRRLLAMGALALLASGWMLSGPLLGLVLAAGTPLAVRRALTAARARRRRLLIEAAPTVARAVADALSGGGSILAAVAGAHRGISGPARGELAEAAHALSLGTRTDEVLERLRMRAEHPAYDAIVAAILLQREAGGDLALLLRRLAATLEEHARAEADARSATAQARFSAIVVACLPVGALALAELAAPGSAIALLAAPLSTALVACSVVLQLAAWALIRRAARIHG